MKILQTIGGFSEKSGGTTRCIYDLLTAVHKLDADADVELLTPHVSNKDDVLIGTGEPWIKVVPNDCKTPLGISLNLSKFLKNSDYDIYHSNGMWLYCNHMTCSIAREKNKPYVITPHGMLYPEALARSSWKKWPMQKLWFNKDIREATCIHVTCEDEMRHLRNYGYKGPVAVIGNPVYIPDFTELLLKRRGLNHPSKWNVAFLGRLHPRKKVENLIHGVAISGRRDLNIYIIGTGDNDYEQYLRTEIKRLGLFNNVVFCGFLNGFEKFEKLSEMDALFVPSDMENFGMIIPESLLVGTPVMASLGTPWESLNKIQCGWWADNSPESIAMIINNLISMSPEERREMGIRGREYIKNSFAAEKIASEMIKLYEWIYNKNAKPLFIYD